ncbi:2-(1,2-epoxy-1,2-dihydrophenyl)acetyl-CoA isomerase [Thermoflexales bacterium]|nr:2-(1,2-epoxy-1,2-dihydrophenyl)acetyl-CoA isomerase [Thermoflexales bacterium]
MAYSTILYDLADGVATLTLNRPEVRNACNDAMAEEVQAALKSAERDENVRCLVITGAGQGFCAGQDLAAVRERGEISFREHLLKTYNPIVAKLRSLEKPVIAAVNGAAAGAGWGIALACDVRYASDTAKFRLAFSGIGLAPDSGTSFFLPRLIGLGRALELAYTNDVLDANSALALGLVNKLYPADQLLPATSELARKLAQAPTRGLGLTKRAMNYALDASLEEALDYEAHLQEIAGRTHDHHEGVQAFLEKRQPKFIGK